MIYRYARVSTDGQSVAAQVAQLIGAGSVKVFQETASGAKTDRRELARAIKALKAGDTLLVTRLDRLARSTSDMLNTLSQNTERQVAFKSLADARAFDVDGSWRAGKVRAQVNPRPPNGLASFVSRSWTRGTMRERGKPCNQDGAENPATMARKNACSFG